MTILQTELQAMPQLMKVVNSQSLFTMALLPTLVTGWTVWVSSDLQIQRKVEKTKFIFPQFEAWASLAFQSTYISMMGFDSIQPEWKTFHHPRMHFFICLGSMILSVLREKKNQCCTINLGPPLANVVSMVWAKEMAGEKIDCSARVWPVTDTAQG